MRTPKTDEIVRPPKEKSRKRPPEVDAPDINGSEEVEKSKGYIGPNLPYVPPKPLLHMPRTSNTDALVHDIEKQKQIEEGFADIKNLREEMDRDKLEIERLKNETRMMIARLLMA
jgi:hypothetical protein